MRGNHQIIVLYHQVVNRADRQIELQGLPMVAIIERDIDPQFRSGKQQPFADRVFADHPDIRSLGNAIGNLVPAFSVVVGAIDCRGNIVEAMAVNCGIRRSSFEMAGFKDADLAPLREACGRYIVPVFAVILGDLNQARVRPDPYLPGSDRRRCDGINHAVVNTLPGVAAIGAAEYALRPRRCVNCRGRVRIDGDRPGGHIQNVGPGLSAVFGKIKSGCSRGE